MSVTAGDTNLLARHQVVSMYAGEFVYFSSMVIASVISVAAFFGAFGAYAQAFSPFLAMAIAIAFILSPIIAIITKRKYYLAREDEMGELAELGDTHVITCSVCSDSYEAPDMTNCPFHEGPICSLCCTLEKSCHDICKKPISITKKGPEGAMTT